MCANVRAQWISQSKNWFLDRRSAVSIPEQVVFMSLFVRRIPVSTVWWTTHRSVWIPLVVHDTLCRRISCACEIPERCERGPARFEIRGAKKPYGRRRGESVKRKISLEPLFWYFVFLPISSTPGPVDFSSRIDREKAMCLS